MDTCCKDDCQFESPLGRPIIKFYYLGIPKESHDPAEFEFQVAVCIEHREQFIRHFMQLNRNLIIRQFELQNRAKPDVDGMEVEWVDLPVLC